MSGNTGRENINYIFRDKNKNKIRVLNSLWNAIGKNAAVFPRLDSHHYKGFKIEMIYYKHPSGCCKTEQALGRNAMSASEHFCQLGKKITPTSSHSFGLDYTQKCLLRCSYNDKAVIGRKKFYSSATFLHLLSSCGQVYSVASHWHWGFTKPAHKVWSLGYSRPATTPLSKVGIFLYIFTASFSMEKQNGPVIWQLGRSSDFLF